MTRVRVRRWLAALCVALATSAVGGAAPPAAAADNTPREIVTETKIVPAMCVAYEAHATERDQVGDLGKQIEKAFRDLLQSCDDAGLHPVGPPTAAVETNVADAKSVRWQAWIPIADKPTADDLAPDAALKVKLVPATRVAATYHLGDLITIQDTFLKLVGWVPAHGLEMGRAARAIIHYLPGGDQARPLVIECQVELGGAPAE